MVHCHDCSGAHRTPQELKHWRAQIAAAFGETSRVAFPRRELHVTYSPVQGRATQAVLVKADGDRDDYTVRLPDGSLKDCTSSRITQLCGLVQAAPNAGAIGAGVVGGATPYPDSAGENGAAAALHQPQLRAHGPALVRQGSSLARIQQLMGMGFSESQADDALHITGEQIDAAIEVCLRTSRDVLCLRVLNVGLCTDGDHFAFIQAPRHKRSTPTLIISPRHVAHVTQKERDCRLIGRPSDHNGTGKRLSGCCLSRTRMSLRASPASFILLAHRTDT